MNAQLAIQVGAQFFSQTAGVPNPGRLLESSRELLKTTNDGHASRDKAVGVCAGGPGYEHASRFPGGPDIDPELRLAELKDKLQPHIYHQPTTLQEEDARGLPPDVW